MSTARQGEYRNGPGQAQAAPASTSQLSVLRCARQAMNLREITKKVGRNIGLNLPAVQLFTKQLLLALHHFRDCGVLHADIKPDNILINARHNAVKVGFWWNTAGAGVSRTDAWEKRKRQPSKQTCSR